MKKKILIATITILAIGTALFFVLRDTKEQLPDTFTINLTGDFTSSAATRLYEGTLTFKDSWLLSGTQTYTTYAGDGTSTIETCTIIEKNWKDSETNQDCTIPDYIALTHEEILKQIEAQEIVPVETCLHREVCYEVVQ